MGMNMEKKVYVILEENVSYDDATAYVHGVHTTMEGAKSGLRRAIEASCAGIKDDIEIADIIDESGPKMGGIS